MRHIPRNKKEFWDHKNKSKLLFLILIICVELAMVLFKWCCLHETDFGFHGNLWTFPSGSGTRAAACHALDLK